MTQQQFIFKSALVESTTGGAQWQDNVAITVVDSVIAGLEPASERCETSTFVDGVAVPAMVNVHSHAFQRGFAGLSEFRTATNDSFWSWRSLMYEFVGKLSPDDVFVIARQLYLEMIAAGYSWVGEFHYLHNAVGGASYRNAAEMAGSVLRAAEESGIGICLLPVLYQRSGFGSGSIDEGQSRFALSDDQFSRMLEACQSKIESMPNASIGMAVHSLRAVSRDSIARALEFRQSQFGECPVHIHVAEQVKEVENCLAANGMRSVEYLLSEFNVDDNWCLIHATHLDDCEIEDVVKSRATVGLCPTTEANLGDGFFSAREFLSSGGSIAIGSDSHCSVDVREELRLLEYGQRLNHRARAVLGTETESVGRRLYEACAAGGGKTIGVSTGRIAVGCRADIIVVDDQHHAIAGATKDRLLDRFVFVNSGNPISKRMFGGCWIDENSLRSKLVASSLAFSKLNQRLLG